MKLNDTGNSSYTKVDRCKYLGVMIDSDLEMAVPNEMAVSR